MFLELSEIKAHLRLELKPCSENDHMLAMYTESAIDYASNYIGRPIPWQDENDIDVPVPAAVKHAILLLIGDFFENRESTVIGAISSNLGTVERLLHFHRIGMGV